MGPFTKGTKFKYYFMSNESKIATTSILQQFQINTPKKVDFCKISSPVRGFESLTGLDFLHL